MKRYVIDTAALAANAAIIRERAGVPVIAVLKADGYGLGIVREAEVLREASMDFFAVTEPEEALTLREHGFLTQHILVMRSTAAADEITKIAAANGIFTIGSPEALDAVLAFCHQTGSTVQAHVKLDTGMGRYGFLTTQYDQLRRVYECQPHITVTGIYTHFHSSFGNARETERQFHALTAIMERLRADGIAPGIGHAANSSGLFCYDNRYVLDAVRIGSAFTGRIHAPQSGLQRIGYLESQVIEVRTVPKGHPVGYGAGYITRRPTQIAVVPVGYIDGFSVEKRRDLYRFRDLLRYVLDEVRNFLGKGAIFVRINGKPARVLGHVGLCHVSLDVTDMDVHPGDCAILEVNPLYVSPNVEKYYL